MATELRGASVNRWLLVLLAASLWLVGCGGPIVEAGENAAAPAATVALEDLGPEVGPGAVAQLVEAGEVAVVDVREDWEYEEGHIPGAVLVPLGSLPERLDEIPTDQPVVLVCRSGNRSGQAYRFLRDQGFGNVHNMTGGMNDWETLGLEVEK